MLVNKSTGELFVYGPIGSNFFEDGVTDTDIIAALAQMPNRRVTIRINSPGGDADMGIAIYNTLKRHKGGVDTVVDSIAASAASVIALAGDHRYAATGSKWMIHRAMTFAGGNSNDMRRIIEMLDQYDKSLVEIYSEVLSQSPEEILQMMDDETWFNAESSLEVGLSTHLGDTAPEGIEPAIASWYRHPPEDVAASTAVVATAKFPVHRNAAEILNRRYCKSPVQG